MRRDARGVGCAVVGISRRIRTFGRPYASKDVSSFRVSRTRQDTGREGYENTIRPTNPSPDWVLRTQASSFDRGPLPLYGELREQTNKQIGYR